MPTHVKTFVEMTDPSQLMPGRESPTPLSLEPSDDLRTLLRIYQDVGRPQGWRQANWTLSDITDHMSEPHMHAWTIQTLGEPIGMVKIRLHPERTAEIGTFGLVPDYVGKGFGGHALTLATQLAWSLTPIDGDRIERVWLKTITWDHGHALPNYLARGYTVFKTEDVAG